MSYMLAVLLGLVQGVTEFLPVSSSGHLVLARHVLADSFGTIEFPLTLDVLLHIATGIVTLLFLRKDIFWVLRALLPSAKVDTSERRRAYELAFAVIIACIPAILVALTMKDRIEESFTSLTVALNGFLLTSLFLGLAHFRKVELRSTGADSTDLGWSIPTMTQALLIGCAQALAILPGVSRSGSTIACALLLGIAPLAAVRFSFFMFLPVVFGAGLLKADALFEMSVANSSALFLSVATCMLAAYFALRCLVWIVTGSRLIYFSVYTFVLSMAFRFL